MAEPIEMLFGMWTRVGPRNHLLDGAQIPMHDGSVLRAKRGWPKICPDMCNSQYTHSDSAGGRNGLVCMPIGVYYMGAHWRHLVNTMEPSMCGGDAALCQITLTTCYC